MTTSKTKHCSDCNAPFSCNSGGDDSPCWCSALPPLMPADFSQDCRCPACLSQAVAERIQTSIESHSVAEMVSMARPYFDPKRLIEPIDYRIDNDSGNYVFSAWYHLKRGSCCGNGCRHCPYQKPD